MRRRRALAAARGGRRRGTVREPEGEGRGDGVVRMLTLEQLPGSADVGEDGRRRIGARRPAGGGVGTALRRRMRQPRANSYVGEVHLGEAEATGASARLRAAGVGGTVRRP